MLTQQYSGEHTLISFSEVLQFNLFLQKSIHFFRSCNSGDLLLNKDKNSALDLRQDQKPAAQPSLL